MRKRYLISITCFILFISILVMFYCFDIYRIDNYVYSKLILIKNNFFTSYFKCCSFLGGVLFTTLLVIFSIIIFKKKSMYYALSIIGAITLNLILKSIFARHRPEGISLVKETGYSLPSSHSIIAIVNYGFIIYYLFKSKMNKNLKIISCSLIGLLMISIPISRVYLGVHYFSDVLAGSLLGTIIIMCITLKLDLKNENRI